MMKRLLKTLIVIYFVCELGAYDNCTSSEVQPLIRPKRTPSLPVVFPEGGTFKLILGWAVPIQNPMKISMIFAVNIQFQYPVPPNSTFFNKYIDYVNVGRKRRSFVQEDLVYERDRMMFYSGMERLMTRYGMDGKECLLRSICEAAESPIDHNGYMGEFLHLLLTPNYDVDIVGDYGLARRAGEMMFDCRRLYPRCQQGQSLFDMITVLENT